MILIENINIISAFHSTGPSRFPYTVLELSAGRQTFFRWRTSQSADRISRVIDFSIPHPHLLILTFYSLISSSYAFLSFLPFLPFFLLFLFVRIAGRDWRWTLSELMTSTTQHITSNLIQSILKPIHPRDSTLDLGCISISFPRLISSCLVLSFSPFLYLLLIYFLTH